MSRGLFCSYFVLFQSQKESSLLCAPNPTPRSIAGRPPYGGSNDCSTLGGRVAVKTILIANRGEIAIRIARAVNEMGLSPVAIHAQDDAPSLHVKAADQALALSGHGARAYLDIEAVVAAAKAAGADAVHPGYGFLSENAQFARAVASARMNFICASPQAL